MGHIRVGRLPKTRKWHELIEVLAESPLTYGAVTAVATQAADQRLRQLVEDTAVNDAFWILTRIAWASHGPNFHAELVSLGLRASGDTSTVAFISELSDRIRERNAASVESGHFSELSSLALRRALLETVGEQSRSLFGSNLDDLQIAFRRYSTRTGFGVIAHRFFADLLTRTVRSVVDRELPNVVGDARALRNIGESEEFLTGLDTYSRQASRIMQGFAEGWYSKHNWESKGQITLDESRGFVAYALRKLRLEIQLGAGGE
jgi:hypothetical protein